MKMDCMQVYTLFDSLIDRQLPDRQREEIAAHLERCDSCASALYAVEQLRASRRLDAPEPRADFLSEIVESVPRQHLSESSERHDRFWLGATIGGAVAAGIVVALMNFAAPLDYRSEPRSPQFTIALNETRDVNVAIDSPVEMMDAAIRVVLTGTVALDGYENQSELRWSTNLDAGVNVLSLPVTMLGTRGGQVLVEVSHEQRHEVFVVKLPGSAPQVAARPEAEATITGTERFSTASKAISWSSA
jgi:hypothetical protein